MASPLLYQNTGSVDCTIPANLDNLKGKTVIVTGGSSGLGAAYVQAFLAAGAHVTNASIVPPTSYTPPTTPNYTYMECDVRSWASQAAVFKQTLANSPTKSIDVVVANAGISGVDGILVLQTSPENPDEPLPPDSSIWDVNFTGVMFTAHLALFYFGKTGGKEDPRGKCLVLKSSLAGYLDLPGAASYNASKFGVRGLGLNLRRAGLCRIAIIAPWFIATAIMTQPQKDHISAALQRNNTEWAEPEDSAKAVLRVASDQSIHGRAFAIVPRSVRPEGYMDLDADDYAEGTLLNEWQRMMVDFTHRIV